MMADSRNGRTPATAPGAVERQGVLLSPPDANQPALADHDRQGRHGQEVWPADATERMPPTLAIALEPLASTVDQTEQLQLTPHAGDKHARNSDWTVDTSGDSIPAPVQAAPGSPWFRSVLLLLMLALLSAVAFWSPETLRTLAASTMELALSTDIPTARTAPGPGPLVGQLDVTSSPSGVELYVDGEPHGVTPAQLVLNAGTHHLTFVSPVGKVRRRVRISPGHRTLFSEAIFPGSLVITSAVGVEMRIDGRVVGRSAGEELLLAPAPIRSSCCTRTTARARRRPWRLSRARLRR